MPWYARRCVKAPQPWEVVTRLPCARCVNAQEHLHAGHLRVTPEYEEMPPVDVDDLARTALQSRDASVTGNPEDMSAEDIMAAAQESVGDDFDLSVLDDSSDDEEVATQSLGNEVADESDGPTSEEVRVCVPCSAALPGDRSVGAQRQAHRGTGWRVAHARFWTTR